MPSCNSCGAYVPPLDFRDHDGFCEDCFYSEATCIVCYDELTVADLDSDGICDACHSDREEFLSCDSCGNTMEEDEANSFDGICEVCASHGY